MASYKEKMELAEPPDVVMLACQRAAASLKWRVLAQERTRFQVRETQQAEQLQIPVQIEMKILPLSKGTGIEMHASNVGFGAAQNQRVQAQAAAFLKKLRFELDRPNMERRQQEIEAERLAQIQREREADERAAIEETAQRAAARASIMQQLHGVAPSAPPLSEVGSAHESDARNDGESPCDLDTTDDLDAAEPSAASSETLAASTPELRSESYDSLIDSAAAPARQSPSSYAVLTKAPPSAPAQGDLVADLERLNTLHKMGALTEDEFRMAKRKLLRL